VVEVMTEHKRTLGHLAETLGRNPTVAEFMQARLERAGFPAEVRGSKLLIGGRSFECVKGWWAGGTWTDLDAIYDRLVVTFFHDEFAAVASRHVPVERALRVTRTDDGLTIDDDYASLAIVRPTYAIVSGANLRLRENFLVPGDHWSRVLSAVGLPRRRHTAERRSAERTLTQLPAGLAADLCEAALAASHRIRKHRSIVYGHPVLLRAPDFALRFNPLWRERQRLLAPFTIDGAIAPTTGWLLIDSDVDPLHLRTSAPDGIALGLVWAIALIGFAELTCVEVADPVPILLPAQRNARSGRNRNTPRQLTDREFGRPRFVPPTLTPTDDTARLLGHYVVGHRRLLRAGQVAGHRAITSAAHSGIVLRSHETWVRPHARGVPDNARLDFEWEHPLIASVLRQVA
jgi:hypothetical protein